jgi:hypothetical protein
VSNLHEILDALADDEGAEELDGREGTTPALIKEQAAFKASTGAMSCQEKEEAVLASLKTFSPGLTRTFVTDWLGERREGEAGRTGGWTEVQRVAYVKGLR